MYAIGFNFPKNSYDQTTNEKNEVLGVFTAALFIWLIFSWILL